MDEDFMFWLFEHYMLTEDDYFDLNEEEKTFYYNKYKENEIK